MHRLSLVRLIRAAKVEVTLLKARWRGLGKEVELRRHLKPACQGVISRPPCISFPVECWRDDPAESGHDYLLTKPAES